MLVPFSRVCGEQRLSWDTSNHSQAATAYCHTCTVHLSWTDTRGSDPDTVQISRQTSSMHPTIACFCNSCSAGCLGAAGSPLHADSSLSLVHKTPSQHQPPVRLNQAHCTALVCVVVAGMLHSRKRLDLHDMASNLRGQFVYL